MDYSEPRDVAYGYDKPVVQGGVPKMGEMNLAKSYREINTNQSKNWLSHWYSERFKLPQFSIENPEIVNDLVNYNVTDILDSDEGSYAWNGDTYIGRSDYNQSVPTQIHEGTHAIGLHRMYEKPLKKNTSFGYADRKGSHNKRYLRKNGVDEAYADLNVFRREFNLDPAKTYSNQEVRQMIRNRKIDDSNNATPSIEELIDMVNGSEKKLANLLNGTL